MRDVTDEAQILRFSKQCIILKSLLILSQEIWRPGGLLRGASYYVTPLIYCLNRCPISDGNRTILQRLSLGV